ncbi:MAG: D-alanine--D-alanine ligase [Deltaproteobacteria bacterium]|nr:D-alanine--D-alanine ligase [Deltaproteobacteria bacterium]
MKVGLTYDLRADYLAEGYGEEETAEFDRPDTIEAIEGALKELGYGTERIGNVRALAARLVAGSRWDVVFNICEGMHGIAREAQVPALLDAYGIPCTFSDATVMALTMHKGLTKHVLRDQGIPTADFHVVETQDDVARVDLPYPLFAKPVAEGTGKGVSARSKIASKKDLDEVCRQLLATYRQPVLVETFLPGREYTVGVVGTGEDTRALGTVEVVLRENAESDAYSYVNKEKCEDLVLYLLANDGNAAQCMELSVRAWRGLGCRDAGRIDFRLDAEGQPCLMELNPLAGLHPEHSDLPIICNRLDIPYVELIRMIMDSAVRRVARK